MTNKIKSQFSDDSNSLFIIGGDGTYLRALRNYPIHSVPPIYAFNTGTLGILLPLSPKNIDETITKIKAKSLKSIERQRLFVKSHNFPIVNEIVILSRTCRLNYFEITIDGEVIKLSGDSLIICTQDGSSGHNFSANGPISLANVIIINCIAANSCNFRPIILPINSKIKIETTGCYASADSFELEGNIYEIEAGDTYRIYVDENYSKTRFLNQQFYIKKQRF